MILLRTREGGRARNSSATCTWSPNWADADSEKKKSVPTRIESKRGSGQKIKETEGLEDANQG